ncbi:MAG: hypothetical protein A2287_08930 [Candidatus Melainabacteria bacterium RIFOXYA12_FULL_32_12]|nr:MAG: hypothetical protein A2255_10400 [Candidatus Melainabacteria bacterium RIFOXYA2_FULL_32_9]OGI31094.1 MAG: hypothetical protein A2287_08930 [Candidatus Melainabacteria bacterium RIFOXYA12_FULL_32_12]
MDRILSSPVIFNKNLIKKTVLDQNSSQPSTNFTGLSSSMESKAFNKQETIVKLRESYPNSLGVTGNLPADWIKEIPKDKREEEIKKLYKAFDEITEIFRSGRPRERDQWSDQQVLKIRPSEESLQKASNILINTFKNAGIKIEEDIKIEKLGAGKLGYAFKFNVNDDKYVFKVYHDIDSNLGLVKYGHGNPLENNKALFIKRNTHGKNQYAPYYFGNVKSGYMIEKYIDKDNVLLGNVKSGPDAEKYIDKNDIPPRISPLDDIGLDAGNDLHDANVSIGGIIFDYGGIKVLNRNLADNKDRKFHLNREKKLDEKRAIENFIEKVKNPNIDKGTKIIMMPQIRNLPEQYKFKAFKELSKDPDKDVRSSLVWYIQNLPTEYKFRAFKMMTNDPDKSVRDALPKQICHLPEEKQLEAHRIIDESNKKHSIFRIF